MTLGVILVILSNAIYVLLKLTTNLDKLFKNQLEIYAFDTFVTQSLMLVLAIVLIESSGTSIISFIKIEKRLYYILPLTVVIGIILKVAGRIMYTYFSQGDGDLEIIQRNALINSYLNTFQNKIIFFLAVGLLAPLSEELFMRAYAYNILRERHGLIVSLIANTIIFVLFHPVLSLVPVLIFTNLLLCLSYEYSKNLFVPIILHSTVNSYSLFG